MSEIDFDGGSENKKFVPALLEPYNVHKIVASRNQAN